MADKVVCITGGYGRLGRDLAAAFRDEGDEVVITGRDPEKLRAAADELGVAYSRQGGYNPAKMIDFFGTLEKMGDLSGGHALPGFLSTHPLTNERIENTRAMITEQDQSLNIRGGDYLKRIQGMVYGSDPRQGYVEGDSFYHPEMRFMFTPPLGWSLQNLPMGRF